MKQREKRTPVRLSARMRSDSGWSDVHIRNVSSRGMMLSAGEAPMLGSYLEVRRNTTVIVGKIVWRSGDDFGVRTQDRIDLKTLLSPAGTPPGAAPGDGVDRRRAARQPSPDRSRQWGRMLQYLFLLAAVGTGTIALVGAVDSALAPLRVVQAHLLDH